jgi:hypothetical protein
MWRKRKVSFLIIICFVLIYNHDTMASWEVESGSKGNELILHVKNTSAEPQESVLVKIKEAPEWVHFEKDRYRIKVLKSEKTERALFLFNITDEIFSGAEGQVELNVEGAVGIWGKKILLTVVSPNSVPKVTALHQNFPNPFHHSTIFHYQLSSPAQAKLHIYDLSGRLIRVLVNAEQDTGYYTVEWDGRDNNGQRLISGIYFTRFVVGDFTSTRKLVLLR